MTKHWNPRLEELALYEPRNYTKIKDKRGQVVEWVLKPEIADLIDEMNGIEKEEA